MLLRDTIWFVPFDSPDGILQPAYQRDAPTEAVGKPAIITAGESFTVSLRTMRLARKVEASWFKKLLQTDTDVLVLSTSALGSRPMVDRVHYYRTEIDVEKALLAHDLLSDVIWVCDDYRGEPFYMELKVMTVDRSDEHREAALERFQSLTSIAGSVFPIAVPYMAIGSSVVQSLNKMWESSERRETYRISEPIRLFPPGTPRAKTIRAGQFIILSDQIDGTKYQLSDDGEVVSAADGDGPKGEDGADLSYAVIRIDPTKYPSIDFVIEQKVATLLTGLKRDQEGQPTDPLKTSLGFLTETLTAYNNFNSLERYRELVDKQESGGILTVGEEQQMAALQQRKELEPWIGQGKQGSGS